jgi:hypothetical protein
MFFIKGLAIKLNKQNYSKYYDNNKLSFIKRNSLENK